MRIEKISWDEDSVDHIEKMKTPEFKNLKGERAFWDTHDATDYLDDFEEAPDVVFAHEKKAVLSLRLEPKISRKLR